MYTPTITSNTNAHALHAIASNGGNVEDFINSVLPLHTHNASIESRDSNGNSRITMTVDTVTDNGSIAAINVTIDVFYRHNGAIDYEFCDETVHDIAEHFWEALDATSMLPTDDLARKYH